MWWGEAGAMNIPKKSSQVQQVEQNPSNKVITLIAPIPPKETYCAVCDYASQAASSVGRGLF